MNPDDVNIYFIIPKDCVDESDCNDGMKGTFDVRIVVIGIQNYYIPFNINKKNFSCVEVMLKNVCGFGNKIGNKYPKQNKMLWFFKNSKEMFLRL